MGTDALTGPSSVFPEPEPEPEPEPGFVGGGDGLRATR